MFKRTPATPLDCWVEAGLSSGGFREHQRLSPIAARRRAYRQVGLENTSSSSPSNVHPSEALTGAKMGAPSEVHPPEALTSPHHQGSAARRWAYRQVGLQNTSGFPLLQRGGGLTVREA